MAPKVPHFLFHFPHSGKMINYEQMVNRVNSGQHVPPLVDVKEIMGPNQGGKRIGSMPPSVAILKFKPAGRR